jgi:hypothetical protein
VRYLLVLLLLATPGTLRAQDEEPEDPRRASLRQHLEAVADAYWQKRAAGDTAAALRMQTSQDSLLRMGEYVIAVELHWAAHHSVRWLRESEEGLAYVAFEVGTGSPPPLCAHMGALPIVMAFQLVRGRWRVAGIDLDGVACM